MRLTDNKYKYIILGAGCSGLSLAYYLLSHGANEPILILDSKTKFTNDRTWCFWDIEPNPFSHLAVHRWHKWQVETKLDRTSQTSTKYPYLCLPGSTFYDYILDYFKEYQNVDLQLGETVTNYSEATQTVIVETTAGTYQADYVFDARSVSPQTRLPQEIPQTDNWLSQTFVGFFIESQQPVFDPTELTLMDFRVDQTRGIHFEYVLPFSLHQALVENVYIAEKPTTFQQHRVELQAYILDRYNLTPDQYTVTHTERGYIPMTDYTFPQRMGQRIFLIGTLGGQTRPSSGYTFVRIQRYCRQLAQAMLGNTPLPDREAPRRFAWFDRVFLNFLRRFPKKCPTVFYQMFARVPSDSLIRFLSDRSSISDELRLILALPKSPFVWVVIHMLTDYASSYFTPKNRKPTSRSEPIPHQPKIAGSSSAVALVDHRQRSNASVPR